MNLVSLEWMELSAGKRPRSAAGLPVFSETPSSANAHPPGFVCWGESPLPQEQLRCKTGHALRRCGARRQIGSSGRATPTGIVWRAVMNPTWLRASPNMWRARCHRSSYVVSRATLSGGVEGSDKNNEKAVRQLDGLLFQGRIVPTEFQKRPSELSGEILLGGERQCQGIFPE